jgi:hypothetical protein
MNYQERKYQRAFRAGLANAGRGYLILLVLVLGGSGVSPIWNRFIRDYFGFEPAKPNLIWPETKQPMNPAEVIRYYDQRVEEVRTWQQSKNTEPKQWWPQINRRIDEQITWLEQNRENRQKARKYVIWEHNRMRKHCEYLRNKRIADFSTRDQEELQSCPTTATLAAIAEVDQKPMPEIGDVSDPKLYPTIEKVGQ